MPRKQNNHFELPSLGDMNRSDLHIDDDSWGQLSALLGEEFCAEDHDWFTGARVRLTGYRAMYIDALKRGDGDNGWRARSKDQAQTSDRIADLLDRLLKELASADADHVLISMARSGKNEHQRWLNFVASAFELRERARMVSTAMRPPPHNVDHPRDMLWEQLIAMFEKCKGKKARASVGSETSKSPRQGTGKLVDFIKAFMATIPHAEQPTGNQIREVERKLRPYRNMVSRSGQKS